MNAATTPRQGAHNAKLLTIDDLGSVSHRRAAEFPSLLRPGDLVVANDAATMPASLHGTHRPTGEPVEVRLAARRSLLPDDVGRFVAVVFGEGDYRTPTEERPAPPPLNVGDQLSLGPLNARIIAIRGHRRLVELRFEHAAAVIWEGIARHGRPIQYAYVPTPLAIWDTWTSIASRPVAFEAPSAGFILDWAMLEQIRFRGAHFTTITHAAGIFSTGDESLDRMLPFDEPYAISATAASLIQHTRHRGGRIVAVGTTVVRALEHSAGRHGWVVPGESIATQRVTAASELRIVDAIVSGLHECGSSHYELLRAFQDDGVLEEMTGRADRGGYRAHEFGDAVFIARRAPGIRELRATA